MIPTLVLLDTLTDAHRLTARTTATKHEHTACTISSYYQQPIISSTFKVHRHILNPSERLATHSSIL